MELNGNETTVLNAVMDAIKSETGGQFGWTDEVSAVGLTKSQIKGYLSQLQEKGYIVITRTDEGYKMVEVRQKAIDTTGRTGFEVC